MKTIRTSMIAMIVGVLVGMVLISGNGAEAAGNGGVVAYPAQLEILIDGRQADIEAYAINGTTYVRMVDVGKEVGFNVYWDGAVQVESSVPYTGKQTFVNNDEQIMETARQEIITQTNEVRKKNGLDTLTVDTNLMKAAQVRATELAATTTYAHTRPDGSKYTTVTDCPYMGENLHRIATRYLNSKGMSLAEAAMDGWLNSPAHLENVLHKNVGSIGVGIAKGVNASGEEAWYCVQLYLVDGCVITRVDSPIIP